MRVSFSFKKAAAPAVASAAAASASAAPAAAAGAAPASQQPPSAPPSSVALAALAGQKRKLQASKQFEQEDEDDALQAGLSKRARLDPAALLHDSGAAPAAGVAAQASGTQQGEDELDAYMKSLGETAPVPSEALHRPATVTLEDIMGSIGHAASTMAVGSEAAPSHTEAGSGVAGSTTDEPEEDAQEAEYRRLFLQQLGRRGPAPAASSGATSAPAAVLADTLQASAARAPAPAVIDVEFTGGEDMQDDINYEDLRGSSSSGSSGGGEAGSSSAQAEAGAAGAAAAPAPAPGLGDDFADDEAGLFAGAEWGSDAPPSALEALKAKLARKDLRPVDHSKVAYMPVRKNLYVEHPSIKALSVEEVTEVREDLEVKLRGRNVPRPISSWTHAGLPDRLIAALEARGMTEPFAIQKQAMPIIMSGRDVIGVAKTGSGKTLAYLLPLVRHVLDQPPLVEGEGPVALVMAPSRELVTQIYTETRKLAKAVGLRVAAIYGGAPVAEQIGELRRGAEIVVCTPGRMIDILTLNAGRLIGMHRVSYVVLDEADRMFDMGFEPQIARLFGVIRPDRQVVLFSATFPTHVEALAKKQLKAPVEVVVGGRSMASADITQFVEVHEERDKFPRLLQLLGHWYERGSVIVFVDTKEHVDMLHKDLDSVGYPSLALHGGKDQAERDQTILDFKANLRTILIATSVAARGLDVQQCVLVVNYSCPNHLEDYVHRVGRTGRGGRKGTAFTFITPGETIHAQDLIRALRDAKQAHSVPPQLVAMAEEHRAKAASGEAMKKASGFTTGQKGFKFDESEEGAVKAAKDAARRAYEVSAGIRDAAEVAEEAAEEEERAAAAAAGGEGGKPPAPKHRKGKESKEGTEEAAATPAAAAAEPSAPALPTVKHDPATLALLRAKLTAAQTAARIGRASQADVDAAAAALAEAEAAQKAAAAAAAAALLKQFSTPAAADGEGEAAAGGPGAAASALAVEELEINDYPPQARNKVMRKETQANISDWTRCIISIRGVYVAPGRKVPPGERKLFVQVEGADAGMARRAKAELRRLLEEETLRVAGAGGHDAPGGGAGGYAKYTV